jgi:transcriptional regulator with XRE-family HTH domain
MFDFSDIGKKIMGLRVERGHTRKGFARKIGITSSGLHLIETGRRYPTIRVLCRIASGLRVSVDGLLTGSEKLISEDMVLAKFRSLPDPEQRAAETYIDFLWIQRKTRGQQ